ncbi:hypothetical protein [Paenibacillus sp. OAE614]|uniref:hypothetical protein n=1 Tax=Paenibacillus sp. OAE614 TaxID=2663804 RepID=UPI00178AA17F
MSVITIPVRDCFKTAELGTQLVPSFPFLNTTNDAAIRLMRLQSKAELTADPHRGVYTISTTHLSKCREVLRLARKDRMELLVTPEYCIPAVLITEMLEDEALQPRPGALWVLACEGMALDDFYGHIMRWRDIAEVGLRAVEGSHEIEFVNFILYVFRSADNSRICLVPQWKMQRMSDQRFVCEGAGLSVGNKVIVFGEAAANQLFTIVCADAFKPGITTSSLWFPNQEQRRYIVLHPQLNPSPRHPEVTQFRSSLFSTTAGRDLIYITANWAEGTTITSQGSTHRLDSPWSTIYRRFINYGGDQGWLDQLRETRKHNYAHGLGLGFTEQRHKVWYAHKKEHALQIHLVKPYDGGAEIAQAREKVKMIRAFVASEDQHGWVESELPFEELLPTSLITEATNEFSHINTLDIEQRDKLFGYSLGHLEKGQLVLTAYERSARMSYHIDAQCEPERQRSAELLVRLIQRLKQKDKLPWVTQRFRGKFLYKPASQKPLNIIPESGNEREGVLVIYTDRPNEMKQLVESLIKEDWFLENRISVLSQNHQGDGLEYPEYSDEFTSPERSSHSTDYTHGGRMYGSHN